jgi:hypothetical protein
LYFWISGSREAATPTVIVLLGVVSVNVFSTLSRVVSPQSLLAAQSFIERYGRVGHIKVESLTRVAFDRWD